MNLQVFTLLPALSGRRVRSLFDFQSGLSLVELLVSLLAGMLVLLAASVLLQQTKSAYLFQDESSQIEAAGRNALDTIARALRQTAFVNLDETCTSPCRTAISHSGMVGLNNASLQGRASPLQVSSAPSVHGSDVLAVRFAGAGDGDHGDATIVNCAGFGIPAASADTLRNDGYGWSIFYVARDSAGIPQLYCKYDSGQGWATQSLASGVDAFQVLYGVDLDGDGVADRIMNAAQIRSMSAEKEEQKIQAVPAEAVDGQEGLYWNRVVFVRVALLISGLSGRPMPRPVTIHDLFGKEYADEYLDIDPGVRIKEAELPESERYRMRKVFGMTLHLPLYRDGSGL